MRWALTIGSIVMAVGFVASAQVPKPEPVVKAGRTPGTELAHGQTVLLGTFGWDIETDQQAGRGPSGPDVWWQQVRADLQNLRPLGAFAQLAKVTDSTPFDKLAYDKVVALAYSTDPVPGSFLVPDSILAVRTNEGNHAKMKVIGYRDSHDFSFEAAKFLSPELRDRMEAQPNIPKRHLELSWVLWEG